MGAEDVLVARKLQNTVEDDVKEKMARATTQLLEAQSRIAEWQAEDERRAREAQEAAEAEARKAQEVRDARRKDALAAEERRRAAQKPKIVAGSGIVGGGSGNTEAKTVGTENTDDVIDITSDVENDDTPVPRTRRRASTIRAGKRKAVESDAGEPETTPRAKRLRKRTDNAEDEKDKTPPPPAPLDVTCYDEYNPAGKTAVRAIPRRLTIHRCQFQSE